MSSCAFPSLMALRHTLRRSVTARSALPSSLAPSSSSTSARLALHTSSLRSDALEAHPSASPASSSSAPTPTPISTAPPSTTTSSSSSSSSSSSTPDAPLHLDSLLNTELGVLDHKEFASLFEDLETERIAVPAKPSLVHVRLSYLSPSTKPPPIPPPAPKSARTASAAADANAVTASEASTEPSTDANANADPATASPSSSSSPSPSRRCRRPPARYVPLSSHVFDAPARRDVLHSAVVYYLDAQRSGTASTKTRSDVRGSKKKLRPQKGSGQARLGTMSNPLLRGGAVAHGPRPRDHSTQLPRRVRELALRSALSARWREGNLIVVPSLDWIPAPGSTNPLARLLSAKQWSDALVLSAPRNPAPSSRALESPLDRPSSSDPVYTRQQREEHAAALRNFAVASANLPGVELVQLDKRTEQWQQEAKDEEDKKKPGELHAYEVLKRKKVICDLGAVEWLEEKLGGAVWHEMAVVEGGIESGAWSEAGVDGAKEEAKQ
ncbi:54S ribosomal protein yml6, mitochondrial [Thecaphora frezii]